MKFLKLVKLYFQRNFVFRLNFIMGWAITILKFLFTVMFWLCALNKGSENFMYSSKEMIIYFFVVMFIGLFIETDITDKVADSIYSGNLSTDLLKPVSYHMLNFANCMAMKLILFAVLVCAAVVLLFFSSYSSLFSLSVLFSLIINFEMCYLIGLLAFWTNTVWGISMVNSVLIDVFGGRLFPILIASPVMQKICAILPYQYIYYVPVQILERKTGIISLFAQVVYSLILFVISQIIFKHGLKRYEAIGV